VSDEISEAARRLSRLGASKGGAARAKALTAEERASIARNAANARWDKAEATPPATPRFGPAPAGPLMCFRCITGTCGHPARVVTSSVHGGGMLPAVTTKDGTALCLDCATKETGK
jgi:hypothetical protein